MTLLVALVGLIAAHRAFDAGQASVLPDHVWVSDADRMVEPVTAVHRADWIGDLIDLLDDIIDILEGNEPPGDGDGDGGGGDGGGEANP